MEGGRKHREGKEEERKIIRMNDGKEGRKRKMEKTKEENK